MKKLFFKNKKELTLCGILEEPNPAKEEVVILVHGYASSKEGRGSSYVAKELTNRKINNFSIDLTGCGESEGDFAETTVTGWSEDVDSAIDLMKERGYQKIDLQGNSAGGIVVMAAALKHPELNRIGLYSTVSDYHTKRLQKNGQKYIDDWKEKGFNYYETQYRGKLKVNYSFYEDAKNNVMYDKVKDIRCPVLIIHGDKDESVPLEQSKRVIKGFPNGKLVILEGADHALEVNGDRTKAINMFADWFEKGKVDE